MKPGAIMQRSLLAVVASFMLASACDSVAQSEGVASAPTTGSAVTLEAESMAATTRAPNPDFVIPGLPPIDRGVTSTVSAVVRQRPDELAADLIPATENSSAMALEFSGCHLRAPGEWVLSGFVALPAGVDSVDIAVRVEIAASDVIYTAGWARFTVDDSGEFAFLVDGLILQREPTGGLSLQPIIRPLFADLCRIAVSHASVPALDSVFLLAATQRSDSLEWDAPPNSIQALGRGVVLSDPNDPRIGWAYLAWQKQPFGLPGMWVPDDPEVTLSEIHAHGDSLCVLATVAVEAAPGESKDAVYVSHWRDCDLTSMFRPDTKTDSAVEGFSLIETVGQEWALIAEFDGTVIIVESQRATPAVLEGVARNLIYHENLLYRQVDALGADEDLEAAIAEVLEPRRAIERGRFPLGDGYAVIATYVRESEYGAAHSVSDVITAGFFARVTNGRWVIDQGGAAGGGDLCLGTDGYGSVQAGKLVSRVSWIAAVGAEMDWTIQVLDADGWRSLDTVGGVYFEGSTEKPVEWGWAAVRAVDASGRVVRCSTNQKQPHEDWSPWQPLTARNDLDVAASPTGRLTEDQVVTVTGNGFYPDSAVSVRMCSNDTTQWVDFWDCDRGSDEEEDDFLKRQAPVDAQGKFSLEFSVVGSFETFTGRTVDCSVERCVIRADGDRGYHQAGWVEVQLDLPGR